MTVTKGNYGTEYCEFRKFSNGKEAMPWLEYDELEANLRGAEYIALGQLSISLEDWFPIADASNDKLFLAKALWDIQNPPVQYKLVRIGANSYQIFRPLKDRKDT